MNCYDSNALLCEYPDDASAEDAIESVRAEYRIQASAETLAACKGSFDFVLSRFGQGMVSFVDAGFEGLRVALAETSTLTGRFGDGALNNSGVSTASTSNRKSLWRGKPCEVITLERDVLEVRCGSGRWTLIPD